VELVRALLPRPSKLVVLYHAQTTPFPAAVVGRKNKPPASWCAITAGSSWRMSISKTSQGGESAAKLLTRDPKLSTVARSGNFLPTLWCLNLHLLRADAMGEVKSQAETDEDILTFDIPDDALERAANAEQAYTLVHCTHPWHQCHTRYASSTIATAFGRHRKLPNR